MTAMSDINTTLKINALTCLLLGALFVFLPQQVITFLSDTNPAPMVAVVGMGVILNIYGLLLLLLGSQQQPHPKLVMLIAVADGLWVLLTAALIISQTWVTHINGITAAGLVAISVGWLGWLQWQYAQKLPRN